MREAWRKDWDIQTIKQKTSKLTEEEKKRERARQR